MKPLRQDFITKRISSSRKFKQIINQEKPHGSGSLLGKDSLSLKHLLPLLEPFQQPGAFLPGKELVGLSLNVNLRVCLLMISLLAVWKQRPS
jgi:hypothetical protein